MPEREQAPQAAPQAAPTDTGDARADEFSATERRTQPTLPLALAAGAVMFGFGFGLLMRRHPPARQPAHELALATEHEEAVSLRLRRLRGQQ